MFLYNFEHEKNQLGGADVMRRPLKRVVPVSHIPKGAAIYFFIRSPTTYFYITIAIAIAITIAIANAARSVYDGRIVAGEIAFFSDEGR